MEGTEKLTPAQTAEKVKRRGVTKGKAKVAEKAQTLERLVVEYVGVDEITPNDYNPNRQSEHDFELLCRSIQEDGFTQPIVVSRQNVIVDGEHRWRAAKTVGYKEIPIVRVNMDTAQARISTIRHNRARGSHDIELEAEVLRDLEKLGALDWAAHSLMMSDDELQRLLEDVPAPEALAGEAYSEAFVPVSGRTNATEAALATGPEAVETQQPNGATITSAATARAIEAQREAEKKIAAAKTEQEKDAARRDARMYRVQLMFNGEDAELVKRVLGNRPAERLVELCRSADE